MSHSLHSIDELSRSNLYNLILKIKVGQHPEGEDIRESIAKWMRNAPAITVGNGYMDMQRMTNKCIPLAYYFFTTAYDPAYMKHLMRMLVDFLRLTWKDVSIDYLCTNSMNNNIVANAS